MSQRQALAIRLLGTPSIEVDGVPTRPPRGRKSWALLAYVLLAERPPSRQRLAGLLFSEADDPLGALRWSLAEIRRVLRPLADVAGDPVMIRFGDDVATVVDAAGSISWNATDLPDGELLEAMSFEGCDAFETWLRAERLRLTGLVDDTLHEHALRELAAGRSDQAVSLASRLVARDPMDENAQELLVRCLATSGQHAAAVEQADHAARVIRRELGVELSPSVRRAAEVTPGSLSLPPHAGGAAARAQLDAGRAAISAGAVEAGLDCLRRAAVDAENVRDRHLHVEALVELGGALVHSVRGRDEEGAAVLHAALASGRDAGDSRVIAQACRELGFIDVQAGRRERAGHWLNEATAHADDDDAELAAILGVCGMNLSDCARYGEAMTTIEESVARADRVGARRQQAWSMSLIARVHALRGDHAGAREVLDRCLEIVHDERWTAFSPWPETLRGDVDLAEREFDSARDRYTHAFTLACQLGDPCWEGVAAKGLALVELHAGGIDPARTWLDDARTRCTRWPDSYQWVHASVLDATCTLAVDSGESRAPALVEELADLASRTGMRELVVRSHVHRARLGQPGALEAATIGAADIDNPALGALVEGANGVG